MSEVSPVEPSAPPTWHAPRDTTAQAIAAALRSGRMRDALGHQLHTLSAAIYFFTLPLAPAPNAIAFAILVFWACVRLPHTWRSYAAPVTSPMAMALAAWVAWSAASLLWSSDPAQGLDELSAYRVLVVPLLVWPILDRVPWLIGSALLGVLAQNAVQGMQALGWLELPAGGQSRLRGLLHPIQTGAWCAAAMTWHMSAVLHARGWLRWVSVALLFVAGVGLLATGSRGPWIAAAVALPLGLVVIGIRRPRTRRMAALLAILGIAATPIAWPLFKDRIVPRINAAVEEIHRAREHEIYYTSSGLRIGLTDWAWSMFMDHPIAGVGAGGFPAAQREHPGFQAALARNPEKERYLTREHPHSTYLYVLACNGAVGGVLTLLVLGIAIRRCVVDRPDHPYADGSLWALVAWLIGAQLDCYNLNGQCFGLFALIISATWIHRPPVRYALSAVDPDDLAASSAMTALQTKD